MGKYPEISSEYGGSWDGAEVIKNYRVFKNGHNCKHRIDDPENDKMGILPWAVLINVDSGYNSGVDCLLCAIECARDMGMKTYRKKG